MTSGWAVVLGAAIALIGSVLGTVIGPWIRDRADRRLRLGDESAARLQRMEDERRARLLVLLTELEARLLRYGVLATVDPATIEDAKLRLSHLRKTNGARIKVYKVQGEVGLLLRPDEAPLERMATGAHVVARQTRRVDAIATANTLLGRWYRGELDAATAQATFQKQYKIDLDAAKNDLKSSSGPVPDVPAA